MSNEKRICNSCAGSGIYDSAGSPPCSGCDGTGRVDAENPAAPAAAGTIDTPGQWVRCTPELVRAGVSCAHTPRRDGDGTYSHDHWISHAATAPVSAVPADERAEFEHWWHEGAHPFRDIAKRKNCQLNEETAWIVWQAAGAPVSAAEKENPAVQSAEGGAILAASVAQPVNGQELPALPVTTYNGYSDGSEPLYTAEQMRDYVLADRAMRQPQGDVIEIGKVVQVANAYGTSPNHVLLADAAKLQGIPLGSKVFAVAAKQAGKDTK